MGNKESKVIINNQTSCKQQQSKRVCNNHHHQIPNDSVDSELKRYFAGDNASVKSISSAKSQQSVSTSSVLRPWSRISRRRWNESTLNLPNQSAKTSWPVTQLESLFLPEFPVADYHKDNKFKKLPEISRGSFGIIYKIQNLETNELFALKVLSKSKIIENNLTNQVTEEVQIQRACGHYQFIVNCPFNWQTRTHLYIEYVDGGELWSLLDNVGVLPLEIVQLYVAQIALAIDFLHNAGVIYRDLKPENLLLDTDANLKLIDFGLSKWLSHGRITYTVCGTHSYMAPEIGQGQPYGHAVDWWSLGAVACLMLTSQMPSTVMMMLPDDMPTRDLLLRLLEVEPKQRLTSLRKLKTIGFYKGYKFEDVEKKMITGRVLLEKHFGQNYQEIKSETFNNFDETFI